MLPTSTNGQWEKARYVVQSSDVLADNRTNITEEGSDRVLWYKESFLTDDEIVEHVVENSTSTLLWSIHKPKRGWYVRLHSPSFPPTTFISLVPVPPSAPYHVPASLSFSCRTVIPRTLSPYSSPDLPTTSAPPIARVQSPPTPKSSMDSDVTLADQSTPTSPSHTYPPPPTPPAVFVSPPSPTSANAKLEQLQARPKPPRTRISPFLLTPHTHPAPPEARDTGLFARALKIFKNSAPTLSNSFSLCALVPTPVSPTTTPAPASPPPSAVPLQQGRMQPSHTPLLTFTDTTPVFTVR
ncbi:hypothetical protein OF83DRAFT_1156701, partial [Amylostereum chailletii]